MKRFFPLLLGLLLPLSAPAQSPQDVLKLGTVFTFERVSRVNANGQPSDDRSTYTQLVTAVGEQVTVTETSVRGTRSVAVLGDLQFPLTVGKTWKHERNVERVSAFGQPSTYQFRGEATVAAEETVTLAGQSVKTYRVEYGGWINRMGGSTPYSWRYTRVDWYAPTIGYVIQSDFKEIDKGRAITDVRSQLAKIDVPGPAATAPSPIPVAVTAAKE